jgi:transitional endoplasmic reticulum ATPase
MSFKKGYIINDKYDIKHFIDSFTYCETYSAKNLKDSKLVNVSIYNASKISRDDLDMDGNLKEISFLKLGIPGLPVLIDHGEFNYDLEKFRYIITKFISGESALDRIKRVGPLSDIEAVSIIEKVTNICDSLHKSKPPILLNGLSLDNIMFDLSSGSEEIMLRNLINLRNFESSFKFNHIDGVPPFLISTESFNNVFTPKSDQFNIGALLFNLIEGIPPWFVEKHTNLNNSEEVDVFLDNRNTPLNFLNNQDDHLKNIITKSLDSNSDNRFDSLDSMLKYMNRETLLEKQSTKPVKKFKKLGNGFDDIGGMDSLKELLKTKVLDVLNKPEHFKKYGVTVPNGMLLYGPPGCGKTFISEKFCEEAGYSFFLIKPSDLSSIYVSGGEEKIGNLFKQAEQNSPSVICFDEVDAVMPKRTEGSHQSISSKVNEFLAQINKCSERGIFVIATTNKPDLIDDAILRTGRLEIQLYVGPPDFEARKSMFKIFLNKRYSEIDLDYNKLSNLTENLVSSDIDFIVNKAAHAAAIADKRISNKIIEDIIKTFKPSVSKTIIDSYNQAHKEFVDEDNNTKTEKPSIGFKKNRN